MQVIVIAAIALVVLIVLILIFTGKIRTFSSGAESCASKGGTCEISCESCEAPTPSEECRAQSMNFCCIDFTTCANDDNN